MDTYAEVNEEALEEVVGGEGEGWSLARLLSEEQPRDEEGHVYPNARTECPMNRSTTLKREVKEGKNGRQKMIKRLEEKERRRRGEGST